MLITILMSSQIKENLCKHDNKAIIGIELMKIENELCRLRFILNKIIQFQ